MKLLLTSSNEKMVEDVSLSLEQRWPGMILLFEPQGRGVIALLERESPDIVILDTELPNGFTLLEEIRAFSNVPVIALVARNRRLERVEALERGADHYVIKPPDRLELQAKVGALLRRMSPDCVDTSFIYREDNFHINFATRTIVSGKKVVSLTPTEYKLLYHLVKNEGRSIPKEALIRKVWGPEYLNLGGEEELRRYIHRLRSKLNQRGERIVTQWGAGYLFTSGKVSRKSRL